MVLRLSPSQRMRASGRFPRALVVALLGLQFLIWGGGSIVEARAAAESLSRYSHVEDQATKCPPIHSHLDCIICRTLNGGAGGVSAPALAAIASSRANRPVSLVDAPADRGLFSPLGSRAPPLA